MTNLFGPSCVAVVLYDIEIWKKYGGLKQRVNLSQKSILNVSSAYLIS